MIVTPYERLTLKVESQSGEEPYLVDLGSYRAGEICNGKCDCRDFQCNIWPVIRDDRRLGKYKPSDTTRCKHIKAAREYFRQIALAFFAVVGYPTINDPDRLLDMIVAAFVKQRDDYDDEWPD